MCTNFWAYESFLLVVYHRKHSIISTECFEQVNVASFFWSSESEQSKGMIYEAIKSIFTLISFFWSTENVSLTWIVITKETTIDQRWITTLPGTTQARIAHTHTPSWRIRESLSTPNWFESARQPNENIKLNILCRLSKWGHEMLVCLLGLFCFVAVLLFPVGNALLKF